MAMAGFACAWLSVISRAFKVVLMDRLLSPAIYNGGSVPSNGTSAQEVTNGACPDVATTAAPKAEPLPPMHLYALVMPLSFVCSLSFALLTEDISEAYEALTFPVAQAIALTIIGALCCQFIGIFSLRDLGGSTQSII